MKKTVRTVYTWTTHDIRVLLASDLMTRDCGVIVDPNHINIFETTDQGIIARIDLDEE